MFSKKVDGEKDQHDAEDLGLAEKPQTNEKGENKVETKEHAGHTSDAKTRAEGELKLKGLKTVDQLNDYSVFSPISVEDQKTIHSSDPESWKKINEDIREHKNAARDALRELDLAKQEEELKLLGVKRFDEAKAKPDFLCVVKGCGEEKAPGQGYHCASHSKGS